MRYPLTRFFNLYPRRFFECFFDKSNASGAIQSVPVTMIFRITPPARYSSVFFFFCRDENLDRKGYRMWYYYTNVISWRVDAIFVHMRTIPLIGISLMDGIVSLF